MPICNEAIDALCFMEQLIFNLAVVRTIIVIGGRLQHLVLKRQIVLSYNWRLQVIVIVFCIWCGGILLAV